MKKLYIYIVPFIILSFFSSCKKDNHNDNSSTEIVHDDSDGHDDHDNHKEEHTDKVTLTKEQANILGISVGQVSKQNMKGYIIANGMIEVPPQNEAVITTYLGANIVSIEVIEGEEVKKGKVLAYISHPEIIKLQTDYLQTYNQLNYLEQDFIRQQKLYDANVSSGRDYQKAKADYSSAKGLVMGYESQLQLLGLNYSKIRKGIILPTAPVKSTINGFIEFVKVKTGQYVQPQTPLFEIVNIEHIHVDLMVFEKDIKKVRNGQKVLFSVKSLDLKDMAGEIFSIGKSLEKGPKALHVHAEIDNQYEHLIVGMYVNAKIIVDEKLEQALPEEAFIKEEGSIYVFKVEEGENMVFEPVEVLEKNRSNGFVSFAFKEQQSEGLLLAKSGAYYLMSELKKSEAGHSH
ncbi:efflux RND transporter periplasmic adaptor subunit [Flavicella sp.]|uniref:efflux RND transporter periplasmic adaptor subunit n=1 Tax=Flavicella sp. TaxID=2957742 RepID=UPI00301B0056